PTYSLTPAIIPTCVTHRLRFLSIRLLPILFFFFFNDTATPEIYTLSLHDALPISRRDSNYSGRGTDCGRCCPTPRRLAVRIPPRSEEHTSELQSRGHLVCRLLLEKKKKKNINTKLTHVSKIYCSIYIN